MPRLQSLHPILVPHQSGHQVDVQIHNLRDGYRGRIGELSRLIWRSSETINQPHEQ